MAQSETYYVSYFTDGECKFYYSNEYDFIIETRDKMRIIKDRDNFKPLVSVSDESMENREITQFLMLKSILESPFVKNYPEYLIFNRKVNLKDSMQLEKIVDTKSRHELNSEKYLSSILNFADTHETPLLAKMEVIHVIYLYIVKTNKIYLLNFVINEIIKAYDQFKKILEEIGENKDPNFSIDVMFYKNACNKTIINLFSNNEPRLKIMEIISRYYNRKANNQMISF